LATSDLETPYNDIQQFGEYVDLAKARSVPLVMVNIPCDLNESRKRLCGNDRKKVGGKTKLVDGNVLEKIRRETLVLGREQAMIVGGEGRVVYFELDTSGLIIHQEAQKVLDFLHIVGTRK
jgi:hypothetical protein